MTETPYRPRFRIFLLIWTVISQLLMVATLFVWIFVVGGAFIIATEAKTITSYWIQAIIAGLYPVIPLTLATTAWVAYSRNNNLMAAFLSGLSFVLPIPVFYFLVNI